MKKALWASLGSALSVALAIGVFLMPGRPDYWIPVVARAAEPTVSATPMPPWTGSLFGTQSRHRGKRGHTTSPTATTAPWSATPTPTVPFVIPTGELGIPAIVLDAYRKAAESVALTDPTCHLTWQMLAGIGVVETDHADGGQVYPDGRTFVPLVGIRIGPDTDHGEWDGDPHFDRAVGPMQFIPSTWRLFGADGNGDGVEDPSNVFDETLAAGHYLCAGGRDLSIRPDLAAALLSYNYSDSYVTLVLAWIDGYTAGQVTPLPPQTPPPTSPPPTSPPPTTPPPTTPPPTTPPPTSPPPTTPPPTTPPTSPPPTTPPPTTPVVGPTH